jgi:hypothetical protein
VRVTVEDRAKIAHAAGEAGLSSGVFAQLGAAAGRRVLAHVTPSPSRSKAVFRINMIYDGRADEPLIRQWIAGTFHQARKQAAAERAAEAFLAAVLDDASDKCARFSIASSCAFYLPLHSAIG